MAKLLTVVSAAMLTMIPASAFAADDFIQGVYLKSQQLCGQAQAGKLQTLIAAGQMALSPRGFDTVQSDCAFLQVLKHPRKDKAWTVTAFCEAPDYASPDVFTIIERAPGKVDVASLAEGYSGPVEEESGDDGSAGGLNAPAADGSDLANSGISGAYVLCDGVTMP